MSEYYEKDGIRYAIGVPPAEEGSDPEVAANFKQSTTVSRYIGDGVFVEFSGYDFRLWTQRATGICEIFLEPAAVKSLVEFACSKGVEI
jgi:hypothetical protein